MAELMMADENKEVIKGDVGKEVVPAVRKAKTRVGAAVLPLVPRDVEECWQMAKYFTASGVVPDAFKFDKDVNGKKYDKSAEQVHATVFSCLQMGATVGLPPMTALSTIMIVNGRFAMYGDAQLAVVRDSDQLEKITETFEGKEPEGEGKFKADAWDDDFAAVCTIKRIDSDEVTAQFTVADAKRANLWARNDVWTKHPKRMLRHRCRAFLLRDTFGDVLVGLGQSVEELQEIEEEEGYIKGDDGVFTAPDRPQAEDPKYAEGEPKAKEDPKEGAGEETPVAVELWAFHDQFGEETAILNPEEWSQAYIEGIGLSAADGGEALENFVSNNIDAFNEIGALASFDKDTVDEAVKAAWSTLENPHTEEKGEETPATTPAPEAAGEGVEDTPAADAPTEVEDSRSERERVHVEGAKSLQEAVDKSMRGDAPTEEDTDKFRAEEAEAEEAAAKQAGHASSDLRPSDDSNMEASEGDTEYEAPSPLLVELTTGDDDEPDWSMWFKSYTKRIKGAGSASQLDKLKAANADMLKESPTVWRSQLQTALVNRRKDLA